MSKAKRRVDFEQRANADPASLRSLPGLGRFIAVNPMTDETELLAQLGVDERICMKVDMYWEFNGDVPFVQVWGKSYTSSRPVGSYVRRMPDGRINVVTVVDDELISSTIVVESLRKVAIPLGAIRVSVLGERLQPLLPPTES